MRLPTIWRSVLVSATLLGAGTGYAEEQIQDPFPAKIPHGPLTVGLEQLTDGVAAPNLILPVPGDPDRLFVCDQSGQIRVIDHGKLAADPVLNVSAFLAQLNVTYDERGLLGMAFDPGFADASSPGFQRIFTYTSERAVGEATFRLPAGSEVDHHSVLASWKLDPKNPNRVEPGSRSELMRVEQPQMNHNAGMIAFGRDGFLYIAFGDGGGANDSNPNGHNPKTGNAQDPSVVLGKILRIDVNGNWSRNGRYGYPKDNPFVGGDTLPEIYALGFRNPWRFSIDGDELIVGDVGQNKVEEVDRVKKGGNYGWRLKEGQFRFNPQDGSITKDVTGLPDNLIDPVLQYDHDEGISITGAFVYRGKAIPELVGKYVFGDYSKTFGQPQGRLFYGDLSSGEIREFILSSGDRPLSFFVKGFGHDEDGEIYVLGSKVPGMTPNQGVVMKIVPAGKASAQ